MLFEFLISLSVVGYSWSLGCLLSGYHCFGFVLSAVFLRLVRVFVAGRVLRMNSGRCSRLD